MAESQVILLVEDNPDDVALVMRALQEGNIDQEVVAVRDGVEALNFLFARGPFAGRNSSVVFVLLDLKMPKIDGLEVVERLRSDRHTRNTPIVVLTSSKEEQDVVSSYDLGVNSYVRKPVDYDHFARVVQQLVEYWLNVNEPAPSRVRPKEAARGHSE